MIKSFYHQAILLALISMLFCSPPARAQTRSLSGRILNASHDSTGISGREITLHLFKRGFNQPADIATALSGTRGRFEFRIADLDTSAHYLISAEHEGVRYYSDLVHFGTSTSARLDISVFDSTRSNQQVLVLMHHLFVQNAGKSLALRESRILSNSSGKTIISAMADGHETEAILRFVLPSNAQNITPISGHLETELKVHGNIIYDVGVFEPGNRQISYVYEIPYQYDTATLEIDFTHPTRSFDIFLADASITLQEDRLIDHGPFTIRGTNYHRYGLQEVEPGQRIRIRFSRQSDSAAYSSPDFLLIATTTLLLAGLIAGAARRFKAKPLLTVEMRDQLLHSRKSLIEEIARLDLESAAEIESLQKRQDLFEKLQRIERTLQQGKSGAKTTKK
ncbi:hypothetical protein JXO59_08670 [candidate division KSB1 bacterium]|nr:hypothetical protein [candidate division KSB1 bacterium]